MDPQDYDPDYATDAEIYDEAALEAKEEYYERMGEASMELAFGF